MEKQFKSILYKDLKHCRETLTDIADVFEAVYTMDNITCKERSDFIFEVEALADTVAKLNMIVETDTWHEVADAQPVAALLQTPASFLDIVFVNATKVMIKITKLFNPPHDPAANLPINSQCHTGIYGKCGEADPSL